jgi:hypothetical protein
VTDLRDRVGEVEQRLRAFEGPRPA